MKKIFLLFLFLYLLAPSYSFAFWPDLDKEQIDEAIKYGKELTSKLGSDSDWSVRSERGIGWVELTTPFTAVAKLARDCALKSKKIKEQDIRSAIVPYKEKLIFNYYYYDIEKRFNTGTGTEYFAMIRTADNRIVYPLRYDTGTEAVAKFSLEFSFSSADIDPNSILVLLVREPSGYEHEFKFDLSKIY
jgi:hypothetical protein